MKKLITAFSLLFSVAVFAMNPLAEHVVTVRITYQAWNEYRPWQKNNPTSTSVHGVVVAPNQVLLPTTLLDDATLIQLEKFGRPPRVPARVIHADPQLGLALITTDSPGFFDDLKVAPIADQTVKTDDAICAAWRYGQLTLPSCRWSRVRVKKANSPYLRYPNPIWVSDLQNGGRGEPLFSKGKLIGLTTSQSESQIGTIPSEIINAYLNASKITPYPQFASTGFSYQFNRGKAQATYCGQTGTPSGIRITGNMIKNDEGCLKSGDILTELNGFSINSQGDYEHPQYGLIDVRTIFSSHYAGETIRAKIIRDKSPLELELTLQNIDPASALIPQIRINTPPPYYVAGGLVFRELDQGYLQAWGQNWYKRIPASLRILYATRKNKPTEDQKRLIILSQIFADEYNLGYHGFSNLIVSEINGQKVDSIAKLDQAFQHPQNGFHTLSFESGELLILDAASYNSSSKRILSTYQIPAAKRL